MGFADRGVGNAMHKGDLPAPFESKADGLICHDIEGDIPTRSARHHNQAARRAAHGFAPPPPSGPPYRPGLSRAEIGLTPQKTVSNLFIMRVLDVH
jgi:hypothetical protein